MDYEGKDIRLQYRRGRSSFVILGLGLFVAIGAMELMVKNGLNTFAKKLKLVVGMQQFPLSTEDRFLSLE